MGLSVLPKDSLTHEQAEEEGGFSSKRVSSFASFGGGAENNDIHSFTAWLYHVTGS